MYLETLKLEQYKNHLNRTFSWLPGINLIVAENGMGKTNILDAIYFLSLSKSYLNNKDAENIYDDKDFFSIHGTFKKAHQIFHTKIFYKKNEKKILKVNNKIVKPFSKHLGKFPIVSIFPQDMNLIHGSSEYRRKFINTTISQFNIKYLKALQAYHKILLQRNSYLKNLRFGVPVNHELLDIYDQQLIHESNIIYQERKVFFSQYQPLVNQRFKALFDTQANLSFQYISELASENFKDLLSKSRAGDLIKKTTQYGIHRDNFHYLLDGRECKRFASQGQQKILLFALKIAQNDIFIKKLGTHPILLFDDIFDKLDRKRVANIFELFSAKNSQHQVFISHTESSILDKEYYSKSMKPNLIEL